MKFLSMSSGLIGVAVLLSIAVSCVFAAPSPTQLIFDDTSSRPSSAETTVADLPESTADPSPAPTTADPVKEEKILRELTAGGRSRDEVKKVKSLLEKSRARLIRQHAQRKALRSPRQRAEEAERYAELKQWEETRRQIHDKLARQQGTPQGKEARRPSIPELNAQAGLDPYLYQGDIELSERQALAVLDLDEADKKGDDLGLMAGRVRPAQAPVSEKGLKGKIGYMGVQKEGSSRPKRQVMNPVDNAWNLWPYGDIHYQYHSNVNSTYRTLIRKSMDLWSSATCLAFYEDTDGDYTMIFSTASTGCRAPIGLSQGVQNYTIQLNAPGCMYAGTIAHEIGHNIGMFHTMNRADRDNTIYVYEDNVDPQNLFNYNKTAASQQQNWGIPYDMGSIMHYDRRAFSGNGELTMTWQGPTYEWDQLMGSQNMLPGMQDFKLINELYECSQYCEGQTTATCLNGGFPKPWGTGMCTTCICPPGIGGSNCQTPVSTTIAGGYAPAGVTNTCNGTRLNATTSWKSLYGVVGSANSALQNPSDYANCHWYMQAPVGYHMQVEVQAINADVFGQCVDGCSWGFTEVRMGNNASDWSLPGRRMCCAEDLAAQFGSSLTFTAPSSAGGREAMVSLYASLNRQSFTLRYRAVSN